MKSSRVLPPRVHGTLDHLLGSRWRDASAAILHDGANLVVRLERGAERRVVRVPRADDNVLQVDRRSEVAALRAASNLGLSPEIVASETRSGLLVTRWLEGEVLTAGEARAGESIEAVAALLARLHAAAGSMSIRRIDLPVLIRGYLDRLAAVGDPMTQICRELEAHALHWLQGESETRVLCHCDVHHRNVLRGSAGDWYLLDWEYAGYCHPLFDLASYACYHGLDESACARMLAAYGADRTEHATEQFAGWRWIFEYVWFLWLRASTGTAATGPPIDADSLLTRLRASRIVRG
jgi:thiamine kinase-like enzyme